MLHLCIIFGTGENLYIPGICMQIIILPEEPRVHKLFDLIIFMYKAYNNY